MITATFTFNGVCCEDFGLTYAPDVRDMYVWKPAVSNVHAQTFDGHPGGYFYGVTKQPKDIVLRVYFEETKITEGILSQVESFYRVGTTGKLTFSRRPWIYYNATIVSYDDTAITSQLNGIITIQMRCYYPYGRCEFLNVDSENYYYDDIIANSGMLENMTTLFPIQYSNLTSETNILLMNPGTETADVALEVAGDVGSGVLITNETTNQSCKISLMSASATSNVNKYYVCDSLNGMCYLTNGSRTEMKPLWHDRGFIQLAPSGTIYRDLYAVVNNTTDLHIHGTFPADVIGKYICLNGTQTHRITAWHSSFISVASAVGYTGTFNDAFIAGVNHIKVSPTTGSTMSLTRLKFTYLPTFM